MSAAMYGTKIKRVRKIGGCVLAFPSPHLNRTTSRSHDAVRQRRRERIANKSTAEYGTPNSGSQNAAHCPAHQMCYTYLLQCSTKMTREVDEDSSNVTGPVLQTTIIAFSQAFNGDKATIE